MGFDKQRVLVDANVWFSRTLLDWIAMLYSQGESSNFMVFWTEDILVEVLGSLRKRNPQWSGAQITSWRDRFVSAFEVGRVADFTVDGTYSGNDPHDAHVHAAAVACEADYLVTLNVSDFVSADPDSLPYEIYTPDDFLVLIDDSNQQLVRAVTRQQLDYWCKRTDDANLPESLRKAGAPKFAERVLVHVRAIALEPAQSGFRPYAD